MQEAKANQIARSSTPTSVTTLWLLGRLERGARAHVTIEDPTTAASTNPFATAHARSPPAPTEARA